MKRYYILPLLMLALAAAILTGCKDEPTGEVLEDKFKELTQLGKYNEAATGLYLYDEEQAQYAVSTTHNTTRIQNDDKSKFIQIVMDAAPEVNGSVAATVTSHGIAGDNETSVSLLVIKAGGGKIWLMDQAARVCYIMPWS